MARTLNLLSLLFTLQRESCPILHGIRPGSSDAMVILSPQRRGEAIQVIVEDNGEGGIIFMPTMADRPTPPEDSE